ncbi:hydroxysteroid dehydrogenase-like protein 2 [Culex pipiens pallens]|uniref:hydroxysteroid dehydrogenase-like protein 2 n=1 Tax=Culex pipiens pallens TaxID=42434 RepID=UPI0019549819|nr:hydroxysteroid dehydrogenase-like protein 2 [Culex pipiens pallens]
MGIENTGKLAGRTLFITGASRGIGKAIALKAARDGANVVIAAKTAEPHAKLAGTIYTAAAEIEAAGGRALACVVDVRDEAAVRAAVQAAVEKFGGIDIVVNNASAISLTEVGETEMKRYDLMNDIITRGTFVVTKECLPYLKKSSHAHILNITPPMTLDARWYGRHLAYTIAKLGSSMCVMGFAEEFKKHGIAANGLWPAFSVHTAAIDMLHGKEGYKRSRTTDVMSDAAYVILSRDPGSCTGNFFIDETVLREAGVTDMEQYACVPGNELTRMAIFLDSKL